MISYADFEKIELRVGTIVRVDAFPKAKNPSYKISIDFGPLGIKQSAAQLTALYSSDSLLGKQIIAVVNFPPKQIANFFSECLILGVVSDDNKVVLLQPEQAVNNGLRIA